MSRSDGILDLVVKQKPFDDIKALSKKEEYRSDSDFWCKRLLTRKGWEILKTGNPSEDLEWLDNEECFKSDHFKEYHTARVSFGYKKDRETILMRIKRIKYAKPNPKWTYGIVGNYECFVIELEPLSPNSRCTDNFRGT